MGQGREPAVMLKAGTEKCVAPAVEAVGEKAAIAPLDVVSRRWKFSELLVDPVVRARWEKVRRYFFLRESTYDMCNRCNLSCDGCYYYEGAKQFACENGDPEAWRGLMRKEKARGITYVVLAGAEPSLVPELLQVCFAEMPLGCIATNGVRRIDPAVGYRIHISVWGNEVTSASVRKAKIFWTVRSQTTVAIPAPYSSTLSRGKISMKYPKSWQSWPPRTAGSLSTSFLHPWATKDRCVTTRRLWHARGR